MVILGIGIKAIEIERFRGALDRWGDVLKRRLFTEDELAYSEGKRDPAVHLAVRFAAKVAVKKALTEFVSYSDIRIKRTEKGRPTVVVTTKGPEGEGLTFNLSMAHDGPLGIAEVVVSKSA